MMHIDFKQPALDADDVKKAEAQVSAMTKIVATLQSWGAKAGNYRILTPKDRKDLLTQTEAPKSLVQSAAFFTEQLRVPHDGGFITVDQLMVGFTSEAFDSSLYGSDAMKKALMQSHYGRCAYCETLINQSTYGDVEHFRPKAAYTVSPSPALYRPAYYYLAYTPKNLFLSCQLCNEAYKQNDFPVIGQRVPDVALDAEVPVLIDPYAEDPRSSIRFNPVDGRAYAFDLVKAFYGSPIGGGLGSSQTEQEIWKDPSRIPWQTDYKGQMISNPAVDKAFDEWLKVQKDPQLQRGTRTISTLNLNRRPLVRARLNQLRQLRCVGWTSIANGVDQQAASELGGVLLGTDARRAAAAPEYLSLSIDALQTWRLGPTGLNGTVSYYNSALEAFVPAEVIISPPPHNDSLMYMVLDAEVKLSGKRRIVYLTDKDFVYGQGTNDRGLFLAIDWDTEIDNAIQVFQKQKLIRQTTLRQLIAGAPQALWRTFEKSEVWAIGEYLPVRT